MNAAVEQSSSRAVAAEPARAITRAKPILWWAALGMLALGISVYALGKWILTNFRPAPVPGPIPDDQWLLLTTTQIVAPSLAIALFAFVVLRPLLRERRMTWDGLFFLACGTIFVQDPINNYFNLNFAYNSYMFNRSSWAAFLPGWHAPGLEPFSEPLLFIVPLCFVSFFVMSVLGSWFLRRCQVWLPSLSVVGHCVILWLLLCLQVFLFEIGLVHSGLFSFFGTYGPLTIWAGTGHQLPLYEITGVATFDLGLALVRFSRDAQGLSFVERGADRLALPPLAKRTLSWLAMLGAVHLIGFFGFFVPYNWMSLKADSFVPMPREITVGLCGEGTRYACPTRENPFPRAGARD